LECHERRAEHVLTASHHGEGGLYGNRIRLEARGAEPGEDTLVQLTRAARVARSTPVHELPHETRHHVRDHGDQPVGAEREHGHGDLVVAGQYGEALRTANADVGDLVQVPGCCL